MRYRCSLCGAVSGDSTTATHHVVREHGRSNFGWYVERVPDADFERPVTWLSNLPLRVRRRCGGYDG